MPTIHITLTGVSPILMNPMTEEILDQLWAPSGGRKAKVEITPKQAAEAKIIRHTDGKIGIPAEYLLAALVTAGKFVKYDPRKNMSTSDSSLVPAFIFLEDMFYPFKKQKTPWAVDKRRGVLNNAGKSVAVCIVRPRFDEWEFDVTASFADIDASKVRQLFEYAGKVAGLCDFRPSCRGPFGRFTITKWQVVEKALAKAA
ncbi:MAG: hypothetical protein AAB605_03125 [Patescibacteria group bacterium]